MHKKVFEVIADFVEYRIDNELSKVKAKVDSPLEQIFLESLVLIHLLSARGFPPINDVQLSGTDPIFGIKTQYPIGKYRADFLLVSWDAKAVIVECDGHDFHERTKEQAARDRQKDRDIQGSGHVILRFTGSEIWADPMKCVGEATTMLFKSSKRIHDAKNFDMPSWMTHGDNYETIMADNIQWLENLKAEASARKAEA